MSKNSKASVGTASVIDRRPVPDGTSGSQGGNVTGQAGTADGFGGLKATAVADPLVENLKTPRLEGLPTYEEGTLADFGGVGLSDLAVYTLTVTETIYRQGGKFFFCEQHQHGGQRFFFFHEWTPRRARNWFCKQALDLDANLETTFAERVAELDRKDGVVK